MLRKAFSSIGTQASLSLCVSSRSVSGFDSRFAPRRKTRCMETIIEGWNSHGWYFFAVSARSYSRFEATSSTLMPQLFHTSFPFSLPLGSADLRCIRSRSPCSLRRTGLESILELAWHFLHRAHAAGACGLSPLGFHSPVIYERQIRSYMWTSEGRGRQ